MVGGPSFKRSTTMTTLKNQSVSNASELAGLALPAFYGKTADGDSVLVGWLPPEAKHTVAIAFHRFMRRMSEGFNLYYKHGRITFEFPVAHFTRQDIRAQVIRIEQAIWEEFGYVTTCLN
jgi:hypothetical protein